MGISKDLRTEKGTLFDLSEAEVQRALKELVAAFGHRWDAISTDDLQVIADKLAAIAPANKHGNRPQWGWHYLRNVLNGNSTAGATLIRSIFALGATLDSVPVELASAQQVTVLAVGRVHPGALVLADSRPCERPGCPVNFVPRSPNQTYHTIECRKRDRKRRDAEKRAGKQHEAL